MPTLQTGNVSRRSVTWLQSTDRNGELEVDFVIIQMERQGAIDWIRTVVESTDDLDWLTPRGDQWFLDLDKVEARFPGLLANQSWAKGAHTVSPEVLDWHPEALGAGYRKTRVTGRITKEQAQRTSAHDPLLERFTYCQGLRPEEDSSARKACVRELER